MHPDFYVECMEHNREQDDFAYSWPQGLESMKQYEIDSDDNPGKAWLKVFIDDQGDAYVRMFQSDGRNGGHPCPAVRICTLQGGGKNRRTRQALIELANAIRLDNLENGNAN